MARSRHPRADTSGPEAGCAPRRPHVRSVTAATVVGRSGSPAFAWLPLLPLRWATLDRSAWRERLALCELLSRRRSFDGATAARGGDGPAMIACTICGSSEWMAVRPGQDAEPGQTESGIHILRPMPAVPSVAWCLEHWPSRRRSGGRAAESPRVARVWCSSDVDGFAHDRG